MVIIGKIFDFVLFFYELCFLSGWDFKWSEEDSDRGWLCECGILGGLEEREYVSILVFYGEKKSCRNSFEFL